MRSARGLFLVVSLLGATGAAGSSAPLSTQSLGERRAFASLLVSTRENPLRECAIMALRDNTGLMAYRIARAGDAVVRGGLTASDDPADHELAGLRDAQMRSWAETHSPGALAYAEFEYCGRRQLVRTPFAAAERTCFNVLAVPAMAEVLKKVHHEPAKTLAEVRKAFADRLPAGFLRQVVSDVYATDAESDDYAVHRQVLATCVLKARP